MGLFNKSNAVGMQMSQRQVLESRLANSRNNILLVVGLTVVNIILLVTNSNTYFLFSAYIPYLLADLGMLFCGLYPSEYYADADMQFYSKGFFAAMLVIATVILVLYMLSWLFSKKQKVGWLIFALVFFSIDTLALFLLNDFVMESVIDYVIHAWVIVSLISGISAYFKLKKLPEDEEIEFESLPENADVSQE